ncbi:MAG: YggT family protein [Bifidobacterium tibiigranuli]|jgi:YggT family protein|uniref:YggT family protein n=1 Tax=Bifidobacterium tibiigranuli TaxID=2172043 RepID=UPI0023566018|nr:YggT family protein [Bifidobacterium tibiigranuli]MCH3974871.1 YggT family protein [Bifidobacterium tibiigranuli]MCH4190520.1 YggT family protein [Bifidobacterium tibiigranuli]MCH4202631.1 YggT family protein [Bifidobacterium tibiigranuli]MCH4273649.1 YggT family protein [Bifidobacterium tibiigranuli]MCI1791272.1 YggT family protein [Bifidobacterium tibiigranuli]
MLTLSLSLIDWLIGAYITVLFIRMILDWVSILAPRWRPRGVIASLVYAIYWLTDPPLRWLRQYIPPVRIGAFSLDVSFIVLYFALIVLQMII